MIKVCCDLCGREMRQTVPQPFQDSCLCENHVQYAADFYHDRAAAIVKALEAHRNRYLQSTAARPKLEAVK